MTEGKKRFIFESDDRFFIYLFMFPQDSESKIKIKRKQIMNKIQYSKIGEMYFFFNLKNSKIKKKNSC